MSASELPFAAFEHFMYADDQPGHPMTFCVRLTLTGVVERARLLAALEATLPRHPLFHATASDAATTPTSKLKWRIRDDLTPYVHFGPEGHPLKYPADDAGIDLRKECGLRLFVRQGPEHATLLAQAHHAVTDATGLVRFLEDLLAHYGETPEALPPLDPAALDGRGDYHLTPREKRRRFLKDAARAFLFLRKIPEAIAAREPTAARFEAARYPAAHRHDLREPELAGLKAGARAGAATLNDLMLRDLFLTLDTWNRLAGRRRAIRLGMAINMRQLGDEVMPGANVVSMCFLDRKGPALDDADALLRGIVTETTYIKRHFMGYAMVRVAAAFGKLRGGIQWMMTPRLVWRCFASAVLSNLGEPLKRSKLPRDAHGQLKAGALTLSRVELLPPVREGTAAAFGVVTYAGRMAVTLHYDQAALSATDAEKLLALYADRLRGSMGVATETKVLFERLLAEHAERRKAAGSLWSLPIGKNVAPTPVFRQQLPAAE